MTKKMTYLFIPAVMTFSAAMAQPAPSDQVLLSSEQMDQVTAGYTASVTGGANASGANLAVTDTTTFTNITSKNGATLEVAGGGSVAVANGTNATTNATLTPTTSQPSGSLTNGAGVGYSSSNLSFQAGVSATLIPH